MTDIKLLSPEDKSELRLDIRFRWVATKMDEVAIGLFWGEPPDYRDKEIKNCDKVKWLWHSGYAGATEGNVSFDDGRMVEIVGGQIVLESEQIAFEEGYYFWLVWAWKDRKIEYASEVRSLSFGDHQDSRGKPCTSNSECMSLVYLGECIWTDGVGHCDYRCASSRDCPAGEECTINIQMDYETGGVCVP